MAIDVQQITERMQSILAFPQELRDDTADFPHITFVIQDRGSFEGAISLYMPPGISISDAMSYSSIDLGVLGSRALKAMDSSDAQSIADKFQQINGSMLSLAKQRAADFGFGGLKEAGETTLGMASQAGAAALARKLPGGAAASAGDIIQLQQKKIFSPNSNTKFDSPEIRSFSVAFKLMAESRTDSRTIKSIVRQFRKYMYPDRVEGSDEALLSYPATFKIEFYDGAKDTPSPNLPKLIDCYLTSMETTYNESGNMFFEDGMPAEVSVSLSFQEVRALTRRDFDGDED